MLATLVGLSMLLALAGGIATLAACLLGRRLRAWQARRHPARAAARQHTQQARRLAAEWPLLAQTLGLGYRDQWTRQHRFPAGEFVADGQGVTATVAAIAGAGLADYQRAATYLADTWGCVSVRAEQQGPLAGRLWSRTTVYLYRALAQLAGMSEETLRRLVRISFAKVAEYQKRGAVHLHAIRLDARTDCGCPACVAPPPAGFTAELLEAAVRAAAQAVAVPCPPVDEDQGVTLVAHWGEQLDVRHITEASVDERELSAEQVAGYIAKYASKSTEALGVTLDHRVCEVELEGLDMPAHVAELVRACWELGAHPSLATLRLRKWAHMLGFGGHFSTKSRTYSTTLGALRRARVAYAIRRRRGGALPLDAWGRPEDDQAVIVVASWHYLGRGYQSTGEAWLAASAAARAREERRIAKEELRTMTMIAA